MTVGDHHQIGALFELSLFSSLIFERPFPPYEHKILVIDSLHANRR